MDEALDQPTGDEPPNRVAPTPPTGDGFCLVSDQSPFYARAILVASRSTTTSDQPRGFPYDPGSQAVPVES